MERKPTWVCTLVTQLCLCLALYGALNLGQPQKSIYQKSDDFYFISVGGGFRPFKQQTHLLKLMERVAKSYQARFVVNTSEFGENDPLKQNATMIFRSLKVPWYTILCNQLPAVGTPLELQKDRSLVASRCIVVGFHPLVVCEENKEQMKAKQIYSSLHHIFMKFGVNLYLSKQGCTGYSRQDSVTYIENPVLIKFANGRETVDTVDDGFLLHRVSSLEIVTYFVTLYGEVVHRTVIRQRGKEVM